LLIVACVRYEGKKVQRFLDSAVPRRVGLQGRSK
jgi:hypothetical protein